MNPQIHFTFHNKAITNYLTHQTYYVHRMVDLEASDLFLDSIVQVCNEQHIYDWLFRARLQGKAYPKSDAEWFHQWGSKGWIQNTHFLFITVNSEGQVVAACDIKTAESEAAEIGYWSSIHHRGVMTNTAQVMIEAGFKAGFKRLYAKVKPHNESSTAVLKRLHFKESTEFADEEFNAFELSAVAFNTRMSNKGIC